MIEFTPVNYMKRLIKRQTHVERRYLLSHKAYLRLKEPDSMLVLLRKRLD